MTKLKENLKEFSKYPSAVAGTIIIVLLIIAAIIVVIQIPYSTAVAKWRGGEEVWGRNPRTVPPTWFNWFRADKLIESMELGLEDEGVEVTEVVTEGGTRISTIIFPLNFTYTTFPQAIVFYFTSKYESRPPHVSIRAVTPDGREIKVGSFGVLNSYTYPISQDSKLKKNLGNISPQIGLFIEKGDETQTAIQGDYQFVVEVINFEENSSLDVDFVLQGQVFGWAGTDHMRRDIGLPLLWGIPVALVFGLLAAVGTSVLTMIFAAIGTWYGGWVDGLIQRLTEINMVLPFLPILIMVGTFYSRNLMTILGVTIALSIFTGGIKSYRAMFMQIKESTYVEAARAYGASDGRIISKYLIPRIIPLLLPTLISSVPAYVFLEASLALLGIGDPVVPTWGKVINDAYENAALYRGQYYWILEPAVLLMITGLAFAMLGFALDRLFNPRLRGM